MKRSARAIRAARPVIADGFVLIFEHHCILPWSVEAKSVPYHPPHAQVLPTDAFALEKVINEL